MAVQISDTSKKVYQKEWKGKHAYDKSLNSAQARALLRWAYNNGNFNGADQNANIDGKWGEYSARRALKAGMNIAKDYSSFTNDNGTYVWDPKVGDYVKQNEIVITPEKQSSLPKEGNYHPGQITPGWMGVIGVDVHGLSDLERAKREGNGVNIDLNNLTDLQARDLYNFLNANPNLNEQDWVRSQENLHRRNMNQIELASVLGTTATSLASLASMGSAGGRGSLADKTAKGISNAAKTTSNAATTAGRDFWLNFKPKMATYWNNGKEALRNLINPANPVPEPVSRPLLYDTEVIGPDGIARISGFKVGGKFQQGGSIDLQIIQLVQAAQQGNQEAIQQLTLIKQAAEQGDQQAIQIMQKIQQIMQLALSAKLGSVLNYIKRIKGECPAGQELVYFKKGGSICKQCVAKQAAKDDDPVKAFKAKCGGKAKKGSEGIKTETESKVVGKGTNKTKYTRTITHYVGDNGVAKSDTVYSKQQIGVPGEPEYKGPSSSATGLRKGIYEKNKNLYNSIGKKK